MPYSVFVSKTFRKQFPILQHEMQERVRKGLEELCEDLSTPRAKADIKPLFGTRPLKHRLRIGDYRVIYLVQGNEVKVIELIKRGKGYGRIKDKQSSANWRAYILNFGFSHSFMLIKAFGVVRV